MQSFIGALENLHIYLNISGIEVPGCSQDTADKTIRSIQAGRDALYLAVQEYLHPYYGSSMSQVNHAVTFYLILHTSSVLLSTVWPR